MRQRAVRPPFRPRARPVALSIDLVLLSARSQQLRALLLPDVHARGRERWVVPWDGIQSGESPERAGMRIAQGVLGSAPAQLEQAGVSGDGERHPGDAQMSLALLGLVPATSDPPRNAAAAWYALDRLPPLAPRQRAAIDSAVRVLRHELDQQPLAFQLLPAAFTLSELQEVYELLLGRRLHKASFRRALLGSAVVMPLEEWRREGRGRPAQLFRYAPRRRRGGPRGLRFDLLAG